LLQLTAEVVCTLSGLSDAGWSGAIFADMQVSQCRVLVEENDPTDWGELFLFLSAVIGEYPRPGVDRSRLGRGEHISEGQR